MIWIICKTRDLSITADKDFPSSNINFLIIAYTHLQNCLWLERNMHAKITTQQRKFDRGRPFAIKGPMWETKLAEATISSKDL